MKLCECGCGEPAPIAQQTRGDRGFVKGEPQRFIRGHSHIRNGIRRADRERGFCGCGCGRLAVADARFIHGHNRRSSLTTLDSNGYEQTRLVPDDFAAMRDSGGYVLLHRLVVAEWLRRPLRADEVVHHRNGDHRDNRLSNLQILTASEHTRLHKRKEVVA